MRGHTSQGTEAPPDRRIPARAQINRSPARSVLTVVCIHTDMLSTCDMVAWCVKTVVMDVYRI